MSLLTLLEISDDVETVHRSIARLVLHFVRFAHLVHSFGACQPLQQPQQGNQTKNKLLFRRVNELFAPGYEVVQDLEQVVLGALSLLQIVFNARVLLDVEGFASRHCLLEQFVDRLFLEVHGVDQLECEQVRGQEADEGLEH